MSTNKKIAIITSVFPPYRGGIGTVAKNHAMLLAQKSHLVTVFTPDYGKRFKDKYFSKHGERIEFLKPVLKYGNAAWVPFFCRKLKDFDAVILEYPFFGVMKSVLRAKKRYNFKLALNYNMDVVGRGGNFFDLAKRFIFWRSTEYFLPRIIKYSDLVLASSLDYALNSNLKKYWDKDSEKFRILPNGVDVKKFSPKNKDLDFKRQLSIKEDEKIILFVGGLDVAHYFKGVEYLIRAVSVIKNSLGSDEKFKVVIAGQGELQQKYMLLAENLGVKDKIMFTGGIGDEALLKLYAVSYATILPSIDKSESFGIVLVESMSSGVPVLSSDLPGVRSVYENNISGITFPVRDETALAEAISGLIKDPQKRQKMSESARELVLKKYDWEKIGDELNKMLL